MSEIITQKDQYGIISHTDWTAEDIGEFLFEYFSEMDAEDDKYPPTLKEVVQYGFSFFSEIKMQYALNGKNQGISNEIEYQQRQGETIDDIIEGWTDYYSYNGGIDLGFPDYTVEYWYCNDVIQLVKNYKISVLDDGYDIEKGMRSTFKNKVKWINPPTGEVW